MKKKVWLILMILFYIGTGIYHFINPEFYLKLMPFWLPVHESLVWWSGVCEILFAVLLIFPKTQQIAAWLITVMLVVFLVCIHIPMLYHFHGWNDIVWWVAFIRMFLQYFLIMWAWRYVKGRIVYIWKNEQ